jgi:hypothetical protein
MKAMTQMPPRALKKRALKKRATVLAAGCFRKAAGSVDTATEGYFS